ncbi:helix-turn-helix transcriptional regulator [Algibacillus agarilyticus]|uniref:helix-turn-helix transcriptional regulator n=1 Tax=Algibacillus agarilyticus TaxID=2234133 RepID=UPI000DD07270|nr:AraC family transcriptional regulator [Algibacillus agarilyticus]
MVYTELDWHTFLRAIIPFIAANVYLMVLIYFTLVRARIGSAYAYFATFMACIILFLSGPLINIMPIENGKRWFDLVRNVLLFSLGMPALVYGLFIQAQITVRREIFIIPILLGMAWSLLFVIAPPFYYHHLDQQPWPKVFESITNQDIYNAQILLVTIQLLLPSLFILYRPIKRYVAILVYAVLLLYTCICIGNIFQKWVVYYAGSALTAIIWASAIYRDIQMTNEKVKQHYLHQSSLAIAQYAAPSNTHFTEYYPKKINESYPFKERAALIETVAFARGALVADRVQNLLHALKSFSQHNLATYRVRAKEVLFMLFDSLIFNSGNAATLIKQLEEKGQALEACTSFTQIDDIIQHEAKFLASLSGKTEDSPADSALVDRIKTFILSHYHKDISLNDIADEIGASRSHITKNFKNLTAQTINQYLIDVRINKSKELLLTQSITNTAFDVGFNNSAYFSTVFKKQTGCTPKEYQRVHTTTTNKTMI